MKNVLVITLMVLLSVNAAAMPSWFDSCSQETEVERASAAMNSDNADMPCHELDGEPPAQHHHCDMTCFCVHASFQQTSLFNGLKLLPFPSDKKARIVSFHSAFASITTPPPHYPPKPTA